ncbi:MAG TPA: ABC transporter permease [Mobilitalea sp.]|nr:ABC transporter permease [Mobilitalea sp.]
MFQIIMKETKEFLREKTNLFMFLMFPVVLVFLLGNLLSSMDNAEETIGELQIHYQVQTENSIQAMTIEGFISTVEDDSNIIFEKTEELEASKLMAGADEITAVVLFTGEPLEVMIYEGTNNIKNRTVWAIMNGFIQSNKSITTILKTIPNSLDKQINQAGEYIKQKDLGINRTMVDYYAVTMLGMICFMSILQGSMAFIGERQNHTINRLLVTPKKKSILFMAKVLGLMPQTILQIVIIMVVNVLVFNAHYASTLGDNLYLFFMFFIVTLAMISIGVLCGFFIKGNPIAILMPIIWVMMFISGTYSKEIYIEGVTEYMPIHFVQEAAFDLSIFGRYQKANLVVIYGSIITIITLSIGAYLFNKKEEER